MMSLASTELTMKFTQAGVYATRAFYTSLVRKFCCLLPLTVLNGPVTLSVQVIVRSL